MNAGKSKTKKARKGGARKRKQKKDTSRRRQEKQKKRTRRLEEAEGSDEPLAAPTQAQTQLLGHPLQFIPERQELNYITPGDYDITSSDFPDKSIETGSLFREIADKGNTGPLIRWLEKNYWIADKTAINQLCTSKSWWLNCHENIEKLFQEVQDKISQYDRTAEQVDIFADFDTDESSNPSKKRLFLQRHKYIIGTIAGLIGMALFGAVYKATGGDGHKNKRTKKK